MWSPYLFCITAVITGVYFYWCSRHKGRVAAKEKVLFVLSALFFYTAAGSPVDLLGHVMFSAHMTQMAVLFLSRTAAVDFRNSRLGMEETDLPSCRKAAVFVLFNAAYRISAV